MQKSKETAYDIALSRGLIPIFEGSFFSIVGSAEAFLDLKDVAPLIVTNNGHLLNVDISNKGYYNIIDNTKIESICKKLILQNNLTSL